ncbi:MAG: hypothetical protein HZB59_04205 [Ignavibacteriales bacterium]|nr:hypothetical protein [Ignavibacteriales bacterium]
MLSKKKYANGQKLYELKGKKLTYFYKNGIVKAVGIYTNKKMEGEWIFYRETGQLWQIANFKDGKKHGSWKRFKRNNKIEYNENFESDKLIKRK